MGQLAHSIHLINPHSYSPFNSFPKRIFSIKIFHPNFVMIFTIKTQEEKILERNQKI